MSLDRTLAGRRVKLVSVDDPYTDLKPGTEGTVNFVQIMDAFDPPSTVLFVRWDTGSNLSLIEGIDRWELLE